MNNQQLIETNEDVLNEDIKFIEKKLEFVQQVLNNSKEKKEVFDNKEESKDNTLSEITIPVLKTNFLEDQFQKEEVKNQLE